MFLKLVVKAVSPGGRNHSRTKFFKEALWTSSGEKFIKNEFLVLFFNVSLYILRESACE